MAGRTWGLRQKQVHPSPALLFKARVGSSRSPDSTGTKEAGNEPSLSPPRREAAPQGVSQENCFPSFCIFNSCDPVWPADAPGAMSSYSACRFAFLFWGLSFLKTQGGKLPCVLFGIRRHQNRFGFMCIVMWEQRGCWGVPGGSDGKESAGSAGDPGLIPGSGRSPGEGNGYTLQCSCLGNSKDRGAWWATVHGVAKSQT